MRYLDFARSGATSQGKSGSSGEMQNSRWSTGGGRQRRLRRGAGQPRPTVARPLKMRATRARCACVRAVSGLIDNGVPTMPSRTTGTGGFETMPSVAEADEAPEGAAVVDADGAPDASVVEGCVPLRG